MCRLHSGAQLLAPEWKGKPCEECADHLTSGTLRTRRRPATRPGQSCLWGGAWALLPGPGTARHPGQCCLACSAARRCCSCICSTAVSHAPQGCWTASASPSRWLLGVGRNITQGFLQKAGYRRPRRAHTRPPSFQMVTGCFGSEVLTSPPWWLLRPNTFHGHPLALISQKPSLRFSFFDDVGPIFSTEATWKSEKTYFRS